MSEASDIARFWAKVRKADGEMCWEWTGALHRGYGHFYARGNATGAHRFAWGIANGVIPAGLHVCHHCDNPPCVRPDHLFIGTPRDNHHDMMAKGRFRPVGPRGERAPAAKLTEVAVRWMRVKHAAGGVTYAALGREHGVSTNVARRIVLRMLWGHVQ